MSAPITVRQVINSPVSMKGGKRLIGDSAKPYTDSRSEAAPARATSEYIPVVRYSVGLAP